MAEPTVDLTREEVTDLLRAWSEGDPCAPEKLTPLIYAELRRLAWLGAFARLALDEVGDNRRLFPQIVVQRPRGRRAADVNGLYPRVGGRSGQRRKRSGDNQCGKGWKESAGHFRA